MMNDEELIFQNLISLELESGSKTAKQTNSWDGVELWEQKIIVY